MTDEVVDAVKTLAEETGLVLLVSESLETLPSDPGTRLVVAESGQSGLEAAVTAHPSARFLLLDASGVHIPIGAPVSPDEAFESRRCFAAGYATSLLAPDYRIGALLSPSPSGGPSAFTQGVVYGCGLCNPAYPPFAEYPLVTAVNSEFEAMAALEELAQQGVTTVYLGAGITTAPLAQAANALGMTLLGAQPPPASSGLLWAGSLRADLPAALRQAWTGAENDSTSTYVAPLRLEHADPGIFSPGRQFDLMQLIERLESGAVRVLTD